MPSQRNAPDTVTWTVHKFGGTSLADADRIANALQRAADADATARPFVVVSAMAGVTDALVDAVRRAGAGDDAFERGIDDASRRYRTAAPALLDAGTDAYLASIDHDVDELRTVLRAAVIAHHAPATTRDLVTGYGELWSARLLAAYAGKRLERTPVAFLDARRVLFVDDETGGPFVDWDRSRTALRAWLDRDDPGFVVATGFVATRADGVATTLGRNGSDLSASIFGRLLDAAEITIWTDVDGVLSADPRRVPEAVVLPDLTHSEAMELAYFGARVLHPRTLGPAIDGRIPVRIRNALSPVPAVGTRIAPDSEEAAVDSRARPRHAVRGLSSMEGLALLDVSGTGMIGVPGISSRLFAALRDVSVSVVLISQASSEHSICVAIPRIDAERARDAVEQAFAAELARGQIQQVTTEEPFAILAAVGDGMVHTPGVSGRLFGALGAAGINVHATAQGASERNISVVVAERDATRALRAVHGAFYLADQTLSVGLIGAGQIGSELLEQIHAQAAVLHERFHVDLRVRGIATSRAMLLDDVRIDLDDWQATLEDRGAPLDLEAFAAHVRTAGELPHAVLVDCTANADVAGRYADWLRRGIHIVTPNKRAGSGPLADWHAIRDACRVHGTHFLCEATVGAGLPVVTTVRDLVQTGDRCRRVAGILSGTLSYLFDRFSAAGAPPFSALVREAHAAGLTEPHPADDLSGMDVARKTVILARELGLDLELDAIHVDSVVPAELLAIDDVDAFLDALPAADDELERRRAAAAADGDRVLRYLASIDLDDSGPRVRVGLEACPRDDPFARVAAGDNVLAFSTTRYDDHPLVVQGPGAGPAVTAGGVFADLLRLAAYLGARP